ncbi:MAG: MFS transporter [Candidatus Omnitrophota bacterium]
MTHIFRALRHRNYRLFFGGQSISLIGTWMQQIAMSWLVYRLTNSAFLLGTVVFFGQIPALILMPFAGVIADRHNRRNILLITQILAMLQAFVLSALVLTGSIEVWQIIALSMFLGLVNSFDMPVRQAFTVEMIGNREDLSNAIALNSSMVNAARLIGPSIAGVVIAAVGEGMCFLINAVSYIAVLFSLSAMRIEKKKAGVIHPHVLRGLKEGFVYAFNFTPIKYILILLGLVSLAGMPYQVLMPVFAKDIFHGGPKTLGFLMAMAGIGALVGAIYLAGRRSVIGLTKIIALTSGIFGLGLVIFSQSRVLWFSMFVICLSGFAMMVQMAASNTILQTIVDEGMRGRVMSFYTMSFIGMAPFGGLLAGILAGTIGAPGTLLSGGICCIIGAAVFAGKLPFLKREMHPVYVKKGIVPEIVN